MSHFDTAFRRVVAIEGGYVDDPQDSGGKTRFGITERVARANGYDGDMRNLPLEVARNIYWRQYWAQLRLEQVAELAPSVAEEMFDTAVNMGTARAGVFLQRVLNALNNRGTLWADMVVDGLVGPVTIGALRAFMARRGPEGERVLHRALNGLQACYYVELAERREKDETFLWGWLRTRIT